MDSLGVFGISNEVIEFLLNSTTKTEQDTFDLHLTDVEKTIEYLKNIGVTNETLNKMFIRDYRIFYTNVNEMKKRMYYMIDVNSFVSRLNADIEYMEYL